MPLGNQTYSAAVAAAANRTWVHEGRLVGWRYGGTVDLDIGPTASG